MADNMPDAQTEDDIADVSLLDTPEIPKEPDTPGETADDKPNEGADTKDKPVEDEKPDAKATEAKSDPSKEGEQTDGEEAPDAKPEEDAAAKAAERERAARQAWQERQRTRQNIAQQLDQSYGPKTQEQLENEGMDPADAKFEALRQEMAYKEERTRIAELNAGMQAEAVNVINDFGVFNPKSPDYDEDFTKEVEAAYKTAARLEVDENGIIINAELPLYDYYQRMANIYNRGTSKGTQVGQQQMQQMLARTENPGGSSSTNKPQAGSLEEMEERLGNVVIT